MPGAGLSVRGAGPPGRARRWLLELACRLLPLWARVPWLCLCLLERMGPGHALQRDPLRRMRHVAEQAQDLIDPDGGLAAPGDLQAIELYREGVACGFYGLYDAFAPIPGWAPMKESRWSERQLRRMRRLGIAHGARVNAGAGVG